MFVMLNLRIFMLDIFPMSQFAISKDELLTHSTVFSRDLQPGILYNDSFLIFIEKQQINFDIQKNIYYFVF